MLSYRHGFHAGNFADVHKHVILVALLDHLVRKEAAICFIDTHAGGGWYDLRGPFARKQREFAGGLLRVARQPDPPALVQRYLELVMLAGTPDPEQPGLVRHYPGSPLLARHLLRAGDRIVLSELHTSEAPLLRELFAGDGRVSVHHRDGYEALPGLVPPRERRGLVLIDPSYELRDEFLRVTAALLAAWRKWPTGVYLVWYPLHRAQPVTVFHRKLVQGGLRKILVSELRVGTADAPNRLGGSGLLVVNPPWQLENSLQAVMPWLARAMARGEHSPPRVYWLAPEAT
jgi:23S rRNA (adenine2030-N6)-methyltransferase